MNFRSCPGKRGNFMEDWLIKTAWPMTPPLPFSTFHICFSLFGLTAAFALAWFCRRLPSSYRMRILFIMGILLAVSECYKQMFLYYVVNHHTYDWWYFPFQLCSIPMYLCLLLPFVSKYSPRWVRPLCSFMYSYNLPGSILVFAAPYGMMHPYWTLTIHSFMWHIILVFIGLLIAFSDMVSPDWKEFARATGLFLACCIIATAVNILARPYGDPDMFYITPYYPTTQPVFSIIAERFGILAGDLSYLATIILGAFILHLLHRRCRRNKSL